MTGTNGWQFFFIVNLSFRNIYVAKNVVAIGIKNCIYIMTLQFSIHIYNYVHYTLNVILHTYIRMLCIVDEFTQNWNIDIVVAFEGHSPPNLDIHLNNLNLPIVSFRRFSV